jgi:hypothetical protein
MASNTDNLSDGGGYTCGVKTALLDRCQTDRVNGPEASGDGRSFCRQNAKQLSVAPGLGDLKPARS